MAEMRRRSNEHSVTWQYARQCWSALRDGLDLPPVPKYQVYELQEGVSKGEKLVKELPITPCKITFGDKSYFD